MWINLEIWQNQSRWNNKISVNNFQKRGKNLAFFVNLNNICTLVVINQKILTK